MKKPGAFPRRSGLLSRSRLNFKKEKHLDYNT